MLSLPYRSPKTWDLLQFVRMASRMAVQEKNMADNYFITVIHQVGVVAKGVVRLGEACLFVTYMSFQLFILVRI